MESNNKNKKQPYSNIPLSNRLLQVFFFSPSTLKDWFNSDDNLRNSESISVFKNRLLLFKRPVQNTVFNIFDPKGLKLLTCLHLGFTHLNEHRFCHNFENCVNPLCSCSITYCTAIILINIVLILGIVLNPYLIILNLYLTILKKRYFYMVIHRQTITKINLSQKQLQITSKLLKESLVLYLNKDSFFVGYFYFCLQ